MSFNRFFLLALFASMGTILFSCSKDGDKLPIDSIEVVSDDQPKATLGFMLPPRPKDSAIIDSATNLKPLEPAGTTNQAH